MRRFPLIVLAAAVCMLVAGVKVFASDKGGAPAAPDGNFMALPDHFVGDLVAMFAFGVVAVILIGFGAKVVDLIWSKLDLEGQVQGGNLAAGIVMASVVLGLCYVVAEVISAVIH